MRDMDTTDIAVAVGISLIATLALERRRPPQLNSTPSSVGAATPADVALAKQQAIAAAAIQSGSDASAANANAIATSRTMGGQFAGSNGAGPIALVGAKVGDRVILVIEVVTAGGIVVTPMSVGASHLESTISVVNQIQQISASDLTGRDFSVLIQGGV